MAIKLATTAVYLSIGFIILCLLAENLRSGGATRPLAVRSRAAVIAALLAAGVFLLGSSPPPGLFAVVCACTSAVICSLSRKTAPRGIDWRTAAVLFTTFCLATTLAWWRRTGPVVDISLREQSALQVTLTVATLAMVFESNTDRGGRRAWWFVYGAFSLMAIFILFSTGLYGQPWMLLLGWHHWGAYIGPAELALAGVRIFHDVPVQYGLGPTALLALSCRSDCWRAMYYVVGILGLLYGTLMMSIAARICGTRQTAFQVAIIGLVTFVSIFVWTAYPPNLGSPALTPSVSGLRFLPLALLIWTLIRRNDGQWGEKPSDAIHLLWILGVFWSPESAFQVTVVWWPYYVWACCVRVDGRHRFLTFLLANAKLAGWLLAGCLAFLLAYRVAYGVLPTIDGYLAYVMYPPGPMPPNLFGVVWFFGAVIIMGIVGLYDQLRAPPHIRQTHHIIVLLLASYGAASYYLGRSHDNNLINISVFFVLLLLALRELRQAALLRVAACGMLAALLSYPLLAGWNSWGDVAKAGTLTQFHPGRTIAKFSYMQLDGEVAIRISGHHLSEALMRDVATDVRTLSEQFHEPITLLDQALNLEASAAGTPWSAYHGPENYMYFPPPLRRQFLANVAARLNAPGWLLIRRDYDATDWLSDYDTVYKRDRMLDFGTYYAIRYTPRPTPQVSH